MGFTVLAKIDIGRVLGYFERGLFYLLIFLLPFQAGLVIFQFAPNPLETVVVKLLDFLVLGILVSWALRSWLMGTEANRILASFPQRSRSAKGETLEPRGCGASSRELVLAGLLFLATAALSLSAALNAWLGLYHWLRLALMVGLFFYVIFNLKRYNWRLILWLLVIAGLLQAAIAGFQFFAQSDLGLQVLGEARLGPQIDGVAKLEVGGQKIVRGYGLLPHPNVLGAFLILAIFSLLGLFLGNGQLNSPSFKKGGKRRRLNFSFLLYALTGLALIVFLFGLFVTFSRSAWLAGAVGGVLFLAGYFWRYYHSKQQGAADLSRLAVLGGTLVLTVILLVVVFTPLVQERLRVLPDEPAVALRQFYLQAGGQMFVGSPVLGVGLGQFVPNLKLQQPDLLYPEWLFQPVHNIYVLAAIELGILGLLAFIVLLILVLRFVLLSSVNGHLSFVKSQMAFVILAFLIIGLFDHFFWTTPAGQYLFWLVLGLTGAMGLTDSS